MRKVLMSILVIIGIFMFTGCSKREVPQGYVGKILTEHGFEPEVLQPGWYTVCSPFDLNCRKKLILLQTSQGQFVEDVTIRMKDNMNLKVDYIRLRVKASTNPKVLNAVFNDIPADENNVITLKKLYNTYGKLIVLRDIREVLSKYTLDDVRLNYSRVTGEIYNRIKRDFTTLPIMLMDINIGRFNYPKIYNAAILEAKKKELEIKKAQAEAAIQIEKIKAQERIAKAKYNIAMQEAKRQADYNRMLGKSVTPQFLELRRLEVQQAMVEAIKNNPNVVYMPYDMMNKGNMLFQIPNKKDVK